MFWCLSSITSLSILLTICLQYCVLLVWNATYFMCPYLQFIKKKLNHFTFYSHTCIDLMIIFKKKIRLKMVMLTSSTCFVQHLWLELLTFGSKDRVEGIMQESLLKRKFVMDMFQKIIDRNIKCCKLIFVF